MKSSFIKYYLVSLIFLFTVTSTLFADKKAVAFGSSDFYAVHRAKRDARKDTNGCLWFSAGFLMNLVGVGIAIMDDPKPRESALIGKSPEYIVKYTKEYKSEKRNIETRYSMTGCIVFAITYCILIFNLTS